MDDRIENLNGMIKQIGVYQTSWKNTLDALTQDCNYLIVKSYEEMSDQSISDIVSVSQLMKDDWQNMMQTLEFMNHVWDALMQEAQKIKGVTASDDRKLHLDGSSLCIHYASSIENIKAFFEKALTQEKDMGTQKNPKPKEMELSLD